MLGVVAALFLAMVLAGAVILASAFAAEGERLARRRRPGASHGRLARWTHPLRGPLGRGLDALANSRLLSAIVEPLPVPPMVSDVRDVVYVSYLVPASSLQPLVPRGLELQRLGEGGKWALFTFLTYRHGHLGFELLGPLRKILFSPVQSNWRIHVRDPRTGTTGVYFVTNAVSATVPALFARLLTEGMPMHVFSRAVLLRDDDDGRVTLDLDPGAGSAPDATASLAPCVAPALDGAWKECFGDYRGFLSYCVPQDRAMSTQPWVPRVTRQEIDLGIPLEDCEPLAGEVVSRAASAIAGDARPLCFRVPAVRFRLAQQAHDPMRSQSITTID
jgi:hypothetical protein